MQKLLITVVLVITSTFWCQAQTPQDSIKLVINNLFIAMKNSDTVALRNSFSETAFLQTFARSKDGVTLVRTETVSDFCKAVGGMAKGMADEQIVYKEILIDGSMASVWTPFKLYINGNFYSCGVNSIQMARLNGQWKIQYIIDTRRKENCVD